jgi:hypothetical protein
MQQFWDKLVDLWTLYLLKNDYFAQILGVDLFGLLCPKIVLPTCHVMSPLILGFLGLP